MNIRSITEADIESPGMLKLLDLARGKNGLTSFQHPLAHQQYTLRQALKVGTGRHTLVAEVDGQIAGMASLVFRKENLYYCTDEGIIKDLPNCWELCGALVSPDHQRLGIYKAMTRTRLRFVDYHSKGSEAKWVIIEVRSKYNSAGYPLTHMLNKDCWVDDIPMVYFHQNSLKKRLNCEKTIICQEAQSVFNDALLNGFETYGINAYDNGPHMRRPIE